MDCITCDGVVDETNQLSIKYEIFCDTEAGDVVIMICDHCMTEANNPIKYEVMELIAACKIFRIKYPESVATPKKKKKQEPEEE